MGTTRWIIAMGLAALFLVMPASASADVQIGANETEIDFGSNDGRINRFLHHNMNIYNTGSEPGDVTVYFEGSPDPISSGKFRVSDTNNCPLAEGAEDLTFRLADGQMCLLEFTFNPYNLPQGAQNANLKLDWVGTDISIPFSANIIPGPENAHLSVTPSPVDFGTHDPSINEYLIQEIELHNDGQSPIYVARYFGNDPLANQSGNFLAYGSGESCSITSAGIPLAVGTKCKIKVQFNPIDLAPGQHSASLTIDSNANDITVPLNATIAYLGGASLSSTSIDFGEAFLWQPATVELTITSTGTVPLHVDSFDIEVAGSEYPEIPFDVLNDSACHSVTVGDSCTVSVSFTPEKGWDYESNLVLTGNFDPITVKLTGTGAGIQASVAQEVDFGEKIVGTSTTLTTPVVSTGMYFPISVDSATISGPGSSSYSLQYDGSTCQNLEYRERCELGVTYSPTVSGVHGASLVVKGNFLTRTVPLTGSARNLTPKLSIRIAGPKKVKRGKTLVLKAMIANTGDLDARGVNLKAIVPKKLAKSVKPIRIKVIPKGKTVTRKIRVKVKKSAKKGRKLKVRLTASGKGINTASASRMAKIK